jgi:flagellar biosynthesis component FlhA
MIYGCGLIEKLRLRKEIKPGEKVFLARMHTSDGSYRLLITGINIDSAEVQAEQWIYLHPGEMVVEVNEYDLDKNTFVWEEK